MIMVTVLGYVIICIQYLLWADLICTLVEMATKDAENHVGKIPLIIVPGGGVDEAAVPLIRM